MSQNCFIFSPASVLRAGQPLEGQAYFSLDKDSDDVEIQIRFIAKEYSRIMKLFPVSNDASNPHKIPHNQKARLNNVDISHDQFSQLDLDKQQPDMKIQYLEGEHGNLLRIVRKYGFRLLGDNQIELKLKTLKAGIYKVPFFFQTQQGWPTSQVWNASQTYEKQKSTVNYVIKFKLSAKGINQKMQSSKEINLNAFTIPKSIDRLAQGDIVNCFCFLKGTTQISTKIQKDVYEAGEDINIICEIDNTRCQSEIGPVIVSMKNRLTLTDESGFEKVIESQFYNHSYEGVMAGMTKQNSKALIMRVPISPQSFMPSVFGEYVQSKNFLIIEAKAVKNEINYQGPFNTQFASKPIIQIPIIILHPSKQESDIPQIWKQAQQLDTKNQPIQDLLSNFQIQKNSLIQNLAQQMPSMQVGDLQLKIN